MKNDNRLNKILFITHDMYRTGAPKVLLLFLRWLKRNRRDIEISLLAIEGGPYEEDFKGTVDFFYQLPKKLPGELAFKEVLKKKVRQKVGFSKGKTEYQSFLEDLVKKDFNLIYANTVVAIPVAVEIKNLKPLSKVIAHVHEAKMILKTRVPNLQNYIKEVNSFIAVSEMVKEDLHSIFGVPQHCITVIYEFSDISDTRVFKGREIGQPFVIGGSGRQFWRKGIDLFLQTAYSIKVRNPDIRIEFVWLGFLDKNEKLILECDIAKAGLEDYVKLENELKDPTSLFSSFDLFLMCSREDPFPLVCIEVGALGVPIICFENGSGTVEVLRNGGGAVVPYLNIEAIVEKILYYCNNESIRTGVAEKAKEIFSLFTPDIQCPKIVKHITQLNEK